MGGVSKTHCLRGHDKKIHVKVYTYPDKRIRVCVPCNRFRGNEVRRKERKELNKQRCGH